MTEGYEKPKIDLNQLKGDIAEMARLLELAGENDARKAEIQTTIEEFKRIQAEVEAAEKDRIDKETVARLEKEIKEMGEEVNKFLGESSK